MLNQKATYTMSAEIAEPKRIDAFLSSLTSGLNDLRAELFEKCPGLWVAERSAEGLRPPDKNPLEIVDGLVGYLRLADIYICILGGALSGGTRIPSNDTVSLVSYFEIEIYQAALFRIPAVYIQLDTFVPNSHLTEFLQILKKSAVITVWKEKVKREHVCAMVRDIIERRSEISAIAEEKYQLREANLAAELARRRGHWNAIRRGEPDILWLAGEMMEPSDGYAGDLNRAHYLLESVEGVEKHDNRLSRIYMAIRELMSYSYLTTDNIDALLMWNRALGLWWGSAAWYGLHTHVRLGTLAGLWSQFVTCRRLHDFNRKMAKEFPLPWGALASGYFSLAKLCRGPILRYTIASSGIYLANRQIESSSDKDPGIYAVRGSLRFAAYNPYGGLNDFKAFVAIARRQPDNLSLNAEAHAYLGKGYTLTRQFKKASVELEESVRLWESCAHRERKVEFLVKAQKHLLDLYLKTGKRGEAERIARDALKAAESAHVFDQARQIRETLGKAKITVTD